MALLVGTSLSNLYHRSSEEKRPSGKSLSLHTNVGCKFYIEFLQSVAVRTAAFYIAESISLIKCLVMMGAFVTPSFNLN